MISGGHLVVEIFLVVEVVVVVVDGHATAAATAAAAGVVPGQFLPLWNDDAVGRGVALAALPQSGVHLEGVAVVREGAEEEAAAAREAAAREAAAREAVEREAVERVAEAERVAVGWHSPP